MKRQIFVVLLLGLSLCTPRLGWADPSANLLNCLISQVFSDSLSFVYKRGQCSANVCELLRQFLLADGSSADLTRAHVLILDRDGGVLQGSSKTGAFVADYHVVLEYDGKVYDLDFGDAREGVPITDY